MANLHQQVQQDLQLQQLLGAYRTSQDINIYLQKFQSRTEQWSDVRRKNSLRYLFNDSVNTLINQNFDAAYDDLIALIKEAINSIWFIWKRF